MIPKEACFLKTTDIMVSRSPKIFRTVLGSCVSVCIWDKHTRCGGMNHFLLPQSQRAEQIAKYGDFATKKLISMVKSNSTMDSSIIAKVFGGANVVSAIKHQIGEKNIQMAKQILAEFNIEIVAEDTGGFRSRFVNFDTSTGKVLIRYK